MGLLEYKAMPPFRDVNYDDDLLTFSNGSFPDRANGVVRQG